jgi:hypothetical protein
MSPVEIDFSAGLFLCAEKYQNPIVHTVPLISIPQ